MQTEEVIKELEDAIRSANMLRTESVVIPKDLAEAIVSRMKHDWEVSKY